MSILVNKDTKVICQGFTGSQATAHSEQSIAYGTNMLSRALSEGAIETLLINADLIRSDEKIDEKFWRDWVKELEQIGAQIVQCSSEHDDGKQLIGMGGAVALLRYSLEG